MKEARVSDVRSEHGTVGYCIPPVVSISHPRNICMLQRDTVKSIKNSRIPPFNVLLMMLASPSKPHNNRTIRVDAIVAFCVKRVDMKYPHPDVAEAKARHGTKYTSNDAAGKAIT